jgi:hypothetical protein
LKPDLTLFCHFLGLFSASVTSISWSQKWDENIAETDISERIHTLHTHTKPVPLSEPQIYVRTITVAHFYDNPNIKSLMATLSRPFHALDRALALNRSSTTLST